MDTRHIFLVVAVMTLQVIWYIPFAEAKHNLFAGTPRPPVSQKNKKPTLETDKGSEASKSETVSIDQPTPVDFSTDTPTPDPDPRSDDVTDESEIAPVSDLEFSLDGDDDPEESNDNESDLDDSPSLTTRFEPIPIVDSTSAVSSSDGQSISEPLAVTWYREKAEQGDVDAQFNLAMISETGFGIKIDYQAAVKWYSKAAKNGHPEAQLKLGMLYLLGLGAPESRIKGGKWVRTAARKENRFARILSQKFLSKNIEGLNVNATLKEVRNLYNSKSPIFAEAKLLTLIARAEVKSRNRPKKERFAGGVTGSGAKAGSVGNRVPDFLAEKKVPKKVVGSSLARIRRHAKEGIADAQYKWGLILEKGNQVPVDKEQSVKWYQAAAEQNHPGGLYKLAIAEMYGVGLAQNFTRGKELLARAARYNHPVSKQLLKYMVSNLSKNGVKQTISITIAWNLQKAIEDADGDAMLSLGYMFQNGWGVKIDRDEGMMWLNKAKTVGATSASRALRAARVREMSIKENNFEQAMDKDITASIVSNSVPGVDDNRKISRAVSRYIKNIKKRAKDLLDKDADQQKPLMLILGGLLLGFMVFRIMRRPANRHSHSA